MTTDLLRKVLVGAAAVAALSVAACNKPTTVDNSTTTDANAMAPATNNEMAPADNAMAPANNMAPSNTN